VTSPFHLPDPFVGREQLLDKLDEIRDAKIREGTQCRILVHGSAGIGSTGLAAAIADRWQDTFPDGPIYLPVGDGDGAGLLRKALIHIGYPAHELPSSEKDLQALYESRAHGKRLLIVFDGVTQADQIAHLVPNSREAVLIATTRRELQALVVHGWKPLRVRKLDDVSSRELLRQMLAADFDTIDASTVTGLLCSCDGHPLAIRVVGGTLAGQPEDAGRLLADMGKVGISALEVDGEPLLLTVLDSVYGGLGDTHRLAYLRLSANPGPHFSLDAAAVLLGADMDDARRMVRALLVANLLERVTDDRLGFHPLIRDHARERARLDLPEDFRERQYRIIEWYRDTGVRWESLLTRRWRESPAYPDDTSMTARPGPALRQAAIDWLTADWVNVERSVSVAADIRSETIHTDPIAVDLGFVLWAPLHLFGHLATTTDAIGLAIEAARRLDASAAVMQLTSQLGTASLAVGDLDAAERYFTTSLELAERIGHGLGKQSALEWLGKVAAARAAVAGNLQDAQRLSDIAFERYDESEAVARTPGMVSNEQLPRVLNLLSLQRARLLNVRGRFDAAVALLPGVAPYFERIGEGDNQAKVLYTYGQALLGLGDRAAARHQLKPALTLFEADGSLRRQAETLAMLAEAIDDDSDAVTRHLRRAEEIYRELDDPRSRDISDRLRAIDPDSVNPS